LVFCGGARTKPVRDAMFISLLDGDGKYTQ
jgi:hypothetical protein